MSIVVSPRFGKIAPQDTPLLQIPSDPLILIFQRLNGGDIDALMFTSKHLYSIFEHNVTWQHLFVAHFPLDDSPNIKEYKAAYQARHKQQYLKFKEAFDEVTVRDFLYKKLQAENIIALELSSGHLYSHVQDDIKTNGYVSAQLMFFRHSGIQKNRYMSTELKGFSPLPLIPRMAYEMFTRSNTGPVSAVNTGGRTEISNSLEDMPILETMTDDNENLKES